MAVPTPARTGPPLIVPLLLLSPPPPTHHRRRYQWVKNSVNVALPAGGQSTYSFTTTAADNKAKLHCVVTNSVSSATSADAVLTVVTAPTITTQPLGASVAAGSAANFSVVATNGGGVLTYTWTRNGVAVPGGPNAASYLYTVQGTDSGTISFAVVVSNAAGSVTSTAALLTVLILPTISTQPTSATVASGTTATFSVCACPWRARVCTLPSSDSAGRHSFTGRKSICLYRSGNSRV